MSFNFRGLWLYESDYEDHEHPRGEMREYKRHLKKWTSTVISKEEMASILYETVRKDRYLHLYAQWDSNCLEALAKMLEATDLQQFLPPIVEELFKRRIKE